MSEARDLFKLNPVKYFPGYIYELEQQNDYLIEALTKEVKQSYEDTGSYSNFSMQVLQSITKKTVAEILTGGE